MRNNFFRGSNFKIPHQTNYILAFSASKANLNHIQKNKELYNSLKKEVGQVKSQIWIVDKNNICKWDKKTEFNKFKEHVNDCLNVTDFSKNKFKCPYCLKEYNMESYFKKHVTKCNEDQKVQKVKK